MKQKRPKGTNLKQIPYPAIIAKANKAISGLCDVLTACGYQFGSHMNTDDVQYCHTALVSHRIVSKFSPPGVNTRDVCYASYLAYDKSLAKIDELSLWGPSPEHYRLRKARALLCKWFASFRIDFQAQIALEFTPGETYVSTGGDVSMIAKLFNLDHWTVSESAYCVAQEIIYFNPWLKRIAKRHIGSVSRQDVQRLYRENKGSPNPGFSVFCQLLAERKVLQVTEGARASSVPKNSKTDRFINVEPFFSVLAQRAAAASIRRILARCGNSLDMYGDMDAQALHGHLIQNANFATIDFSNASDSVTQKVVSLLFPENLTGWLFSLRSQHVKVANEWYEPKKLSSMGNGFTFEVMSALLYAVAVACGDTTCRVYGDDVIIRNEFAERFVQTCELIGFQTNQSKTFVNSKFRESCGKFFHDDAGYLVSFDIRWCDTFSDVCTAHNKLFILSKLGSLDPFVSEQIARTRKEIHDVCLASQKGHVPHESRQLENLSSYIWSVNVVRSHKQDDFCRSRFKRILEKQMDKWKSLQWLTPDGNLSPELLDVVITSIPVYVPKKLRATEFESFVTAILASKRIPRQLTNKGKWVNIPAMVWPNGTLVLCRSFHDKREISYNRKTRKRTLT